MFLTGKAALNGASAGRSVFPQCFLLVTGLDDELGLRIPTDVLTDEQANRTWDDGGFSIALQPTRPVKLRRSQPFARIVLLLKLAEATGFEFDG